MTEECLLPLDYRQSKTEGLFCVCQIAVWKSPQQSFIIQGNQATSIIGLSALQCSLNLFVLKVNCLRCL